MTTTKGRSIGFKRLSETCPHLSSADHEGSGTNCIADLCAESGTNVMQGTRTTEFTEHEFHVKAK